jgi:flagellar hook-associated protein 3 FlgL
MRVTNMYQAQVNITRIQKSSEDVFNSDSQVATGLKAEKYSDVAADLSQILKTKESQSQLESYNKNLTTTESYLASVEASLQSMQSILTEATSLATLALNENTPEDRAALAATAGGLASNLDALLNQKFQDKYVFSGQATNIPVTSGTSPKVYAGVPSDTSYYEGASEKLTTVVSAGVVMEYGITGDNQGFSDLKAGLEALWYGLENNDEASLKGALDLINNAQNGFGNMIGVVGGEMKQVDILQEQHQNTKEFLATQLQQLQGVDSAEAISNLKTNEAVLEANLSLMSRINQVSLLDFLR